VDVRHPTIVLHRGNGSGSQHAMPPRSTFSVKQTDARRNERDRTLSVRLRSHECCLQNKASPAIVNREWPRTYQVCQPCAARGLVSGYCWRRHPEPALCRRAPSAAAVFTPHSHVFTPTNTNNQRHSHHSQNHAVACTKYQVCVHGSMNTAWMVAVRCGARLPASRGVSKCLRVFSPRQPSACKSRLCLRHSILPFTST